ncbi:tape measure protein [uncultured Bifidobacterium sp.]|jgi:tape measure domain-containing protein|uniref:tape measure protein n=1 Tax=uncultured Bifidobacterium sp. TaxID=165187 RepID=UPI0027DD6805|nr:tape measure protein [uncultured Bifidobacterium sp.]
MVALAHAYVQIVPSMQGVGKAIEKSFGGASETIGRSQGGKLGGGMSSGFAGKIGAIAGISQTIAGQALDAFLGLAGGITEASDSSQKFASTLQFAGVGEQQIRQLTASTQEYADKTVYELNDIRNTTAQLAANGVPNYDRLAEAAGNLNAVAGGTADTYKSVAMVLTQTAGQGKLTTENWNQLSDAIPGASGKIQQALLDMGAYTGNFRDAMSQGEISAQEFNDAIMQLGFTDAAVEAATSAATIEGAMGNLEASAIKLGAAMLDEVKPAVTGGIGLLSDAITNAVPIVQNAIGGITQWIGQLWQSLNDNGAVTAFKAAWDAIADAIGGIATMVVDWTHLIPPDTIANGIKLVADALNWFIQHGPALTPIIAGIGTAFAAVKGYQALNAGLQALTGTMNAVTTGAKGLSNGIMLMMDLGGPVATIKQMASSMNIVKTAQAAWNAITTAATAVQGAFNAVLAANPIGLIVTAIAAVVAALALFFTQTETGRQLWASFTQFISSAWQTVVTTITGWGQQIANFFTVTIPAAFQSALAWFQQLPANIATALTTIITNVAAWATNMAMQALAAGQQFVSNVVNFITTLPETIAYWLAYIITFVVVWVAEMAQNALQAGQQFLNNVVSFVTQLPGMVASFLSNIISNVTSWASQMAQNALQAGQQFLNNVVSFVTQLPGRVASFLSNAISNAANFASQMAQSATQAGQQFLNNIVSTLSSIPSRVASIGSNIVSGLVNGITGSIGRVASAIMGGVSNAIASVKNMLGIHSPSRVFRDEIGRMSGKGLAIGFEKSADMVSKAAADMIPEIDELTPSLRIRTDVTARHTGIRPTPTAADLRDATPAQDPTTTASDLRDAIADALKDGVVLMLNDRGCEVMAGKLAKPMGYQLEKTARRGR